MQLDKKSGNARPDPVARHFQKNETKGEIGMADMIQLKFPDGAVKEFEQGTTTDGRAHV